MKISAYQNVQPNNFKARLFNPEGEEVKSFDIVASAMGSDEMARRGNPNTVIHTDKFISLKDFNDTYTNYANIRVENPLFKTVRMIYPLHHKTNEPINGISELQHLDLLTGSRSNNCETLENLALEKALLETAKKGKEKNPNIILENLLARKGNCDFPQRRINDFKRVANDLLNKIIEEGLKQLN